MNERDGISASDATGDLRDGGALDMQPLDGVRVVELAQGISGPYAGKLLADYGAEVIKVEPPDGDETRRRGPSGPIDPAESASPLFLHLNTNKRSIVADPTTPEGAHLLRGLLERADVLIESGAPGALDACGLDLASMRAANPGLCVLRVTAFGQDGPYAGYLGEEIVHYAVGGPLSATGQQSREPVKMGGDLGQYQCGSIGALSCLAALAVAERRGRGVEIDLSNVETQVGSIDRRMTYLLYWAYTQRDAPRADGRPIGAMPNGVYPTADGHVLVSTMPAWVPRMLRAIDDPDLASHYEDPMWILDENLPDIADSAALLWTVTRDRQSAMEEGQASGWPVTAMNRPVDLLTDPHFSEREYFVNVEHPQEGSIRQPGAPFRMTNGWALRRRAPLLDEHAHEVREELAADTPRPDRQSEDPSAGRLPLDGVRVLDMTVVWSGPYATTLLGDLGAEIVRIDNPAIFPTVTRGLLPRPPEPMVADLGPIFGGYPDLDPGDRPWNRVALFTAHARNKKCITLDLRKELGRETFLRLIERSDIVVENNAVDLMDKLGLGWDDLRARNPRLIMIRMPSVGSVGPYRDYLGFGVNFEALAGLGSLRGYPDLDLSESDSVFHMDAASGSGAAFAALAALRRRERTGRGELVEFSQAENMMNHIGEYFVDASRHGEPHPRLGNRHPTRAPQGVYPCAGEDRWIALSVGTDEQWSALAEALGAPERASDERFSSAAARMANHDALDELLREKTAAWGDDELFHALQAVGVPCGPVLKESDCYADRHLRERGMFRTNGSPDLGRHEYATHPFKWDGPALAWGEIPVMGGDNEAIYRGVLGLDDEGWQALVDDGHISTGYVGPDGAPL